MALRGRVAPRALLASLDRRASWESMATTVLKENPARRVPTAETAFLVSPASRVQWDSAAYPVLRATPDTPANLVYQEFPARMVYLEVLELRVRTGLLASMDLKESLVSLVGWE